MRYLLTGYLAFVAIVAFLGAAVSMGGLPSAFERLEGEPEDYYGLIVLISFCALVVAYCLAGVLRGIRNFGKSIGVFGYVGSLLIFLLGALVLVAAIFSPLDHFLILPGILVILCPAAYFWLGDVRERVGASSAFR